MDKWCMIAVMKKSKQLHRLCVKFYFKRVMKWVSRCIACYKNLPHVAFASQGYDIIYWTE